MLKTLKISNKIELDVLSRCPLKMWTHWNGGKELATMVLPRGALIANPYVR